MKIEGCHPAIFSVKLIEEKMKSFGCQGFQKLQWRSWLIRSRDGSFTRISNAAQKNYHLSFEYDIRSNSLENKSSIGLFLDFEKVLS